MSMAKLESLLAKLSQGTEYVEEALEAQKEIKQTEQIWKDMPVRNRNIIAGVAAVAGLVVGFIVGKIL